MGDKTITYENGEWRKDVNPLSQATSILQRRGANNYSVESGRMREKLEAFFNGVGAVEWQENSI
jgi:hypothetical protein